MLSFVAIATLANATLVGFASYKGLEVMEAHHLFDLDYSQIHVLIHPEGVVHAMAEFRDGSLRAEMARADSTPAARASRAPSAGFPAPADPRPLLVAASVGPYGAWLADGAEYRGRYGLDLRALRDFHREVLSDGALPLDVLEAKIARWTAARK